MTIATKTEWKPPGADQEFMTARVSFYCTEAEKEMLEKFVDASDSSLSAVMRAAMHFYINAAPETIPKQKKKVV